MVTSLPPYHRTRPCLAPRSCEPCRALDEVSGNTPGYAHLAVSLRLLQARVWTDPAHRAAQPSHTEGQQPTRKSLSFNKLMVGTCEPLTCHCVPQLQEPAAQAVGTARSGPQCPCVAGTQAPTLGEQLATSLCLVP